MVVLKYKAPTISASPSLSTEGAEDLAPRYLSSNESYEAAADVALEAAEVALEAAFVSLKLSDVCSYRGRHFPEHGLPLFYVFRFDLKRLAGCDEITEQFLGNGNVNGGIIREHQASGFG